MSLGGFGGLDLGVKAGYCCRKFGTGSQLRPGEEFDSNLVSEVGSVLVVLAGFGGGEPGLDYCLPAATSRCLELVEALLPPSGRHAGRLEAVHASGCHLSCEFLDKLVA